MTDLVKLDAILTKFHDAIAERDLGPRHRHDAEFNEADHPRNEDGKFGNGAASHTTDYHASLQGKKGNTAGLMKHLLMKGVHHKAIFKAAQEHYGLADNKKGYVKWYHSDLIKSGLAPPALNKGAPAAPAFAAPLATPPKSPEAPVKSNPINASQWKQTGKQLGSNPGGKYRDENGGDHYLKQSKSADHAKNEVLAGKLYKAAGSPIVEPHLVDTGGGKLGTATDWQKVDKGIDHNSSADRDAAAEHFATHAWLANWDAAGLEYDNQSHVGGKMTTMDVGGALNYRAQGGSKGEAFGNKVGEWDSLRDKNINPQNASVFGKMTSDQLASSAKRVLNVSDDTIKKLVNNHGPGDAEAKTLLVNKLIARREDIRSRVSVPAQPKDETVGSPIARKWAQQGQDQGLVSTFKGGESPTVYHGTTKNYKPGGFMFVTKSKTGAEFHAQNGGSVSSYKLAPGAKLYPDMEGGYGENGHTTLLQPSGKYGGSSGIVHHSHLIPEVKKDSAVRMDSAKLDAILAKFPSNAKRVDAILRRFDSVAKPTNEARMDAILTKLYDNIAERDLGPICRHDADFVETDHPRAEDGKFTAGASGTIQEHAEEYKKSLGGKKPNAAGLIKHLIKKGSHYEHDIFSIAQAEHGLTPDKAGYVKWYHKDMIKNGLAPPTLLTGKNPAGPQAAKITVAPKAPILPAPGPTPVHPMAAFTSKVLPPNNPNSAAQISVHNIAIDENTTIAEKIAKLKFVYLDAPGNGGSYSQPTQDYAKEVIKALGGSAASTALSKIPLPTHITSAAQNIAHSIAMDENITVAEKLKKLHEKFLDVKPEHGGFSQETQNYVTSIVNLLDDTTPPIHSNGPTPHQNANQAIHNFGSPMMGPYATKTFNEIKIAVASADPKTALADIKLAVNPGDSSSVTGTAGYVNSLLQSVKDYYGITDLTPHQNANQAIQNFGSPQMGPYSTKTVEMIKAAVASADPKTALANIPAVYDSSGNISTSGTTGNVNTLLKTVQGHFGVMSAGPKPAVTPSAPATPSAPPKIQEEVYHKAKSAPHKHVEFITELEAANGTTLSGHLRANTKDIAKDFYAKVTAAYGNNPDGMTSAVDDATQEYASHMLKTRAADTRNALALYRDGESGEINAAAAGKGMKPHPDTLEKVAAIKRGFKDSFCPADTPVYRGLKANFEELTGFKDPQESVGRAFEHKNFCGTSRSESTSANFGDKTMLHFTVPAGTPALLMGGQKNGTSGPLEREMLLDANSVFRIDKVEQKISKYGHVRHFVHCTYLGKRKDAT